MDFGGVGFDSLVCSSSLTAPSLQNGTGSFPFEEGNNYKLKGFVGSGFLKQQERGGGGGAAINEEVNFRDFKMAKNHPHQMLSFSGNASPLPYFHHTSTALTRNSGYGFSSGMNISGFRGPFTPSQWMELEHQALIYKYINANVPIPSYLLNPIRKAFESAGYSTLSTLRSNPLGWGAFHLGFSNSDPEPGRCRRTDGKKWRCSRDAVADQKYCERHMNRGRHRSRKPVEGQSGHASATSTNSKLPPIGSAPAAAPVAASSNNSLGHNQLNNLQQSGSDLLGLSTFNRNLMDNKQSNSYSVQKQQNSFQEFGLVCSDSLLNPLNRSSSLIHSRIYGVSDNPNKSEEHHSLRHFMDSNNWSKNQSDRTQLSISIPMSDYTSSAASSPKTEKPERPSQELEMGLGVGTISWESSIAGPLGEVLHNTSNTNGGDSINTKPLNLIDNWDNNNSPHLAASPTGVLQRSSFVSLSNSSAGSSPRAESTKTLDGASLGNGIVAGLMNPSLPTLI